MIEDYDNEDYDYFKEWDIEQYKKEIERLHSIIKEVREYIKTKYIAQGGLISYEVNDLLNELLEILDKVNREDK